MSLTFSPPDLFLLEKYSSKISFVIALCIVDGLSMLTRFKSPLPSSRTIVSGLYIGKITILLFKRYGFAACFFLTTVISSRNKKILKILKDNKN